MPNKQPLLSRAGRALRARVWTATLRVGWQASRWKYLRRLERHPALAQIYQYYRRVSPSTGVQVWDAVMLYEAVRRYRPRHVLEFGTGASTAFLALALQENHVEDASLRGQLVSLESEPYYLASQLEIFPNQLRGFVDFIGTPLITRAYDGETGFAYRDVPRRPYEMIWVDGPALTPEVRFSGDVIDILPHCAPHVRAFFDGRDETARKVHGLVGGGWQLEHFPFLHMWELRRSDCASALAVDDVLLEWRSNEGPRTRR